MSIIGESILAVTVEMLAAKLASEVIKLFARRKKIEAGLNKWTELLETIKVVLDDAEEKQITDTSVKMWLGKLQILAYDAEDILDDFAIEAFQRRLLLEQPSASKFQKLIPACCTKFSPQFVKFDSMIANQIEEITGRFEEIATKKGQLQLNEISGGIRYRSVHERLESTSLVDTTIYGRENDQKAIVELLTRGDLSNKDVLSVIPITGMGGLGKTTLAQLVYNDDKVQRCFDFRFWVYVSECFDPVRITKVILGESADVDDLNLLQVQLKNKLYGKKFLLVLDDMWSENYVEWTNFFLPLKASLPSSKIIVTTRSEAVSSMVTTGEVYSLQILSHDDCLHVFANILWEEKILMSMDT